MHPCLFNETFAIQLINVYIYPKICVHMRTNIVIDDQLMDQAIALSGLETKKAVVKHALKLYIQLLQQDALRELRGKLRWEGNLDQMR